MTAMGTAMWFRDLWRAASALRQACLPYRETDERVAAALDALDEVLGLRS